MHAEEHDALDEAIGWLIAVWAYEYVRAQFYDYDVRARVEHAAFALGAVGGLLLGWLTS